MCHSKNVSMEDLLASLPHAEVLRADGDLLFSERLTRRGWGLVERDGEGAFRWALGSEAAPAIVFCPKTYWTNR